MPTIVNQAFVNPLVETPTVTDAPIGHLVENDQSFVLATGDIVPRRLADYLQGIDINALDVDVLDYGADPTGVADSTTAFAAAIAAALAATPHMKVHFPAGTYKGSIVIRNTIGQQISGLTLYGDGKATRVTSLNNATALSVYGDADIINQGSGQVRDIDIKDMSFFTSGVSGIGVQLFNVIGVTLENIYASGGLPYTIQGTGAFALLGCQGYVGAGPAALYIGDGDNTLTNSGPGAVIGGQYTNSSLTASPAIKVFGDPLGVTFQSLVVTAPGFTGTGVIVIDGDLSPNAGINFGSLDFVGCYAESTYNTSNNAATFLIGGTQKTCHVGIWGGCYYGHGDGVHYQQDFVRIVSARSVTVRGVSVSKAASPNPGFSRSMIRLESTFPAAGELYAFTDNIADISGNMYSDANGILSAARNATSDYIVGAWTPTLLFGGANAGMTASSNVGHYTRIGETVFCEWILTLTAKGASTGAVTLTGLPYVNAGNTTSAAIGFYQNMAGLVSGANVAVASGGSIASLYTGSATGVVAATEANFTNTTSIRASFSYRATS